MSLSCSCWSQIGGRWRKEERRATASTPSEHMALKSKAKQYSQTRPPHFSQNKAQFREQTFHEHTVPYSHFPKAHLVLIFSARSQLHNRTVGHPLWRAWGDNHAQETRPQAQNAARPTCGQLLPSLLLPSCCSSRSSPVLPPPRPVGSVPSVSKDARALGDLLTFFNANPPR